MPYQYMIHVQLPVDMAAANEDTYIVQAGYSIFRIGDQTLYQLSIIIPPNVDLIPPWSAIGYNMFM